MKYNNIKISTIRQIINNKLKSKNKKLRSNQIFNAINFLNSLQKMGASEKIIQYVLSTIGEHLNKVEILYLSELVDVIEIYEKEQNNKKGVKMKDLIKRVKYDLENGIDDGGVFTDDVETLLEVFEKVTNYVEDNGDISIACGSEWLFQSDEGQVSALDLVGQILDYLEKFATYEDF